MSTRFSEYIKTLRENMELTQEELGARVGLSKFQISLIESSQRGASKAKLEKLIDELRPSSVQMQELRRICREDGVGISLPSVLSSFTPAYDEMTDQKEFSDIHVVATRPIEAVEIGSSNRFLSDLIDHLRGDGIGGIHNGQESKSRYVYWTAEESLPLFKALFDYIIEEGGVSEKTVAESLEVITGPQELCLLSCAIYSSISTQGREQVIGRILIRSEMSPRSFTVTQMGQADVRSMHAFLSNKYEVLKTLNRVGDYRRYRGMEIRQMSV